MLIAPAAQTRQRDEHADARRPAWPARRPARCRSAAGAARPPHQRTSSPTPLTAPSMTLRVDHLPEEARQAHVRPDDERVVDLVDVVLVPQHAVERRGRARRCARRSVRAAAVHDVRRDRCRPAPTRGRAADQEATACPLDGSCRLGVRQRGERRRQVGGRSGRPTGQPSRQADPAADHRQHRQDDQRHRHHRRRLVQVVLPCRGRRGSRRRRRGSRRGRRRRRSCRRR